MSIANTPLQPIGQEMLARAADNPDDANLWMNLSTVMLCLGQRDIGLAIQDQALALKRVYHLAAAEQPAKLRLLMLMVPGDLGANTPLECLLENTDIDLDFYYVSPGVPLLLPIPEHDALMVAISECDETRTLLASLEQALAAWPKPVINAPQHIPTTGRAAASTLLQDAPGLLMPPTLRVSRQVLQAIATGKVSLSERFSGCDFPIILRPIGSHGGRDLDKIEDFSAISGYLARVGETEFYLSPFIDYSSKDGLFRKMRVALIDGVPFACHMAISSNWMIHYVNAGMYEEPRKRDEEASFMAHFDDFARRHRAALEAIFARTKLDYLCIDCAETADGQFLVFEIDPGMVVHAMDPAQQFPYKQPYMEKVKNAFRDFLFRLTGVPQPTRMLERVAEHRGAVNPRNSLNFSGGPGALPESVLLEAQQAIIAVPEVGLSVLGISHRSDWFAAVIAELETNIRKLLGLSEDYHVLLLQGGATQQYSMVPMTLLHGKASPAEYVHTGYWSGKAVPDAKLEGAIRVVWSGEANGFKRLPRDNELAFSADAPYMHYISNETVEGLQFHRVLGRDDVPRVCDMSSDFLSKPCEAERFSLIYAHAQKNIGPAGVTVVLIRNELLKDAPADLPSFLDYRSHIETHSNFNTPPVFAIYVVLLVTRWLINEIGGVARMAAVNQSKAELLYRLLDNSDGFYRGRAAPADRSLMNVTFNLDNPELEQRFLAEALAAGFSGLSGHRAIGGVRASIYNALTLPAAEMLAGFMEDFQRRQSR